MASSTEGLASTSNASNSETSEHLAPWNKRWSDGNYGWHKEDVNHHLLKHGGAIIPNFDDDDTCVDNDKGVRVFVPLCGKSVDMAFLANKKGVSEVVGVDGIRKALEEFSTEHPSLQVKEVESIDGFGRFEGKGITLLKGDFFQLDKASVGKFEAVWDRASIIAIPPDLREDYVRIIGTLVKPGGALLVSTLERREGGEEAKAAGPPFSVDEKEIRTLYEGLDWVESVTKIDEVDEMSERFKSSGLTEVYGLAFVIKAKQ